MSTPSDTSRTGTPKSSLRATPVSPARSRFDPDGDWQPDEAGQSFTNASTVIAGEDSTIHTIKDCELEFTFSGDSLHPVGVVCSVHDWYGDIH